MAERMFEKSFEEHEDLQRKVTIKTLETDEFRRKVNKLKVNHDLFIYYLS